MTPKLQIVAVADGYPKHDYLVRGYEAFLKSSRRYGFEPLMLGWGQPWGGLGSKPKLLKRAIDDGTVNANHIIFADAYDVWFASSPMAILETFIDIDDGKIIWNAEKDCFPVPEFADKFQPVESEYRYLNSGLSIGETAAYLECLTEMEVESWRDDHQDPDGTWTHRNDQRDWQERFLFGQCGDQVKMSLDPQCYFFQTLTKVTPDELDISPGRVFNNATCNEPMAFHANGPSKTDGLMEPILAALDL